jgi:inorganic triphosphatase YgiF
VELEGATAELALDQGVLLGNGRQIPLCEVEVEHKSGDEAVTAAFAQALANRFGLAPEGKSKFRRAMDLAQSE